MIPDMDLTGNIKKDSVSLTPIDLSTSPKSKKSSFCCSIGQILISPQQLSVKKYNQ